MFKGIKEKIFKYLMLDYILKTILRKKIINILFLIIEFRFSLFNILH